MRRIGSSGTAAWRAGALLVCLVAGGCAATPGPDFGTRPPPEARAPGDEGRGVSDPEAASPSASSRSGSAEVERAEPAASRALLEQSRSERAAGSYAAAASSIERALRIDPNNAALWLELGEIKLADDDPQQAQMMARKALTLAGPDEAIADRAERLIDRAACTGGRC